MYRLKKLFRIAGGDPSICMPQRMCVGNTRTPTQTHTHKYVYINKYM